jgi:hypothetical protein
VKECERERENGTGFRNLCGAAAGRVGFGIECFRRHGAQILRGVIGTWRWRRKESREGRVWEREITWCFTFAEEKYPDVEGW